MMPSKWNKAKPEEKKITCEVDKNKPKNSQVTLNSKEPKIYDYFTSNDEM